MATDFMRALDTDAGGSKTQPDVDCRRLLYRSQFVLAPGFVDAFSAPQRLTLRRGLHLTVHPDLNLQVARRREKTIVLLGFLLDPENPAATDAQILQTLVQNFVRCSDLFDLTSGLGGRWILLADDGRNAILFHDPAGLRQVFYSDVRTTRSLWCGSQPGLMADLLDLRVSDEAERFLHAPEIARNAEHWWPGDSSPHAEIRRLLPNHYLNLEDGTCQRFWPNGPLAPVPTEVAVQDCSALLAGLLSAAARRFDLALPLTAGWDSRLLLAAARGIRHELSYFTLKIQAAHLTEAHPDLAVPRALLGELGLKHEVIELPRKHDEEFGRAFDRSVRPAHPTWRLDAQAILEFYRLQKVVVAGGVSEVARNFYTLPRCVERRMTGEKLASLAGMGRNPFAVEHFAAWLGGLGPSYNLRVLDLFYWEQRAGSWLATCQKEFDVAWQDIFSPYNCRKLLGRMLAVNNRHRRAPGFRLYRALIANLWPEVLKQPINPHKAPSAAATLKKNLKNQLLNVKYFLTRR